MKPLALVALCVIPGLAHADAVSTLERGVKYAAKEPTDHLLQMNVNNRVVTLRKDEGTPGIIVVSHKLGNPSHGYFLQSDGKLGLKDRVDLKRDLGDNSRELVVRGLKDALKDRRSFEAHIAKVAPQIDAIVADAKQNPTRDHVYSSRLAYTVTASGPTLLVDGHGFFLGKQSFALSADQRAAVSRTLR